MVFTDQQENNIGGIGGKQTVIGSLIKQSSELHLILREFKYIMKAYHQKDGK